MDKYDAETFLAKYKYFNRLNKVNSQASLYVDTGNGFNESDKVAIDYSPLKRIILNSAWKTLVISLNYVLTRWKAVLLSVG